MANLLDRFCSFAQTASKPLPQSEIQLLAEGTFPELRRIASASSQEERDSVLRQLMQRLNSEHLSRMLSADQQFLETEAELP